MSDAGDRPRAQPRSVAVAGRGGRRCSASARPPASPARPGPARQATRWTPIDAWHALLRPDVELTPAFTPTSSPASMRARKLTFGDRVHCPFLRPFFLTEADEARMRTAAETHRRARRARRRARRSTSPALFDAARDHRGRGSGSFGIDPGYARASTASRLDAFLLPDSLHFAEYNAESPAGPGLHAAALRAVRRHCR